MGNGTHERNEEALRHHPHLIGVQNRKDGRRLLSKLIEPRIPGSEASVQLEEVARVGGGEGEYH